MSANLDADADLALVIPSYTFATPVLGGQATIGLMGIYGQNSTSVDARLNAALLVGPFARHEDAAFALRSARLATSSVASITRVTNAGSFMARLASMASPRLLNITPLWSSSSSATSNGAIRAA